MKLSELTDEFDWNRTMGTTARRMRDTGFETLGFLIYRCTYGDDAVWDLYMKIFKEAVHDDLVRCGRELLMEQYAQWTVIEDKETLDGVSKQHVRERFVQWRDQHSVEWEQPDALARFARKLFPTPSDVSDRLPRFTYCLYVDQKCLDKMKAYLDAKANGTPSSFPRLVAVIIDSDYSPAEYTNPYRRYPDLEGCTDKYVGWKYAYARSLASLYDELHSQPMDTWGCYCRPPAAYPTGLDYT
ncbi:hypothetical protein F4859DRAFT_475232 [Xylaria cf. heliscus]|nr:hypothetical protein F4859DRAFT_475232 [Xylaria cf. heliscus]